MLGYKELPFEVMQTGEFYYELLKSGRIKIDQAKRLKSLSLSRTPVTLYGGQGQRRNSDTSSMQHVRISER